MQPHIPDKIKTHEYLHKLVILQTVRVTHDVGKAVRARICRAMKSQ